MSDTDKNKGQQDPKKKKNKARNNNSKSRYKRKNDTSKKSNFNGECIDLKGHVFETFIESKDSTQYAKTTKALMNQ